MSNESVEGFARFAGTDGVRANLKQRSVRGALFMASGAGLDFALRLVAVGILARLLVPEHFGLIAMVTALTGILEGVRDLGLATATVQRHHLTHGQVSNLFWVNVAAGCLFAALFCAAASPIADFYDDERLRGITVALSLTFVWSGLTVQHEALMTRQLRQGELALIRLVANLVSFGVAILLALEDWGYWSLVWREVIRTAAIAIGVWLRCPWLPGVPRKEAGTGSLLRFGRDLSYTQLLYGAISNVDRLLVGKLFGAAPLGEYRLAHQVVVQSVDQFNAPIGSVANPGLSMLQNDPGRYRNYYAKVVFLIAMGTMPVAAFATVYAPELTTSLLGPAWAGAAPYFAIFAASAFIRPVLGTASTVLISRGLSGRFLAMTAVSNLAFLAFIAIGYRWGPAGVAMAHLATPAVLLLPNLWFALRDSPVAVGVFFRAIRTPLLASAIMVAVLGGLRTLLPMEDSVTSLGLGLAAGTLVYAAACLMLPGGRDDVGKLLADVAASVPSAWLRSRTKPDRRL
jgi:PST family polysaccharide transporter